MKIKLGQTVRDVVSGFQGIAVQTLEQMNGNVQIAIQPAAKEGETAYPEAVYLDHHMLDVLDAGVSARATPVIKTDIKLGETVKDNASGFEGIAIEKATYLNGCVRFGVMPKHKTTGLLNDLTGLSWISVERLEVLGAGVSKKIKPVTDKPPGGPSSRVQRKAVV